MGDEPFGAVQDVAAIALHGGGLGTPRIGSGVRLGETEPTEHLPASEEGYVSLALFLGAEVHDRRRAERGVRRDGQSRRRVDARELLDREHVAEQIESGPAELLRPRNTEQPELAHLLDGLPWEGAVGIVPSGDGRYFVTRELANHLTHGEVLLGEIQLVVHVVRP